MQGVILLLFAKYYHLPFLKDVQTDCTRTGLGGYWVSEGEGEGEEGAAARTRDSIDWASRPGTVKGPSPRPTPYSEARLFPPPTDT